MPALTVAATATVLTIEGGQQARGIAFLAVLTLRFYYRKGIQNGGIRHCPLTAVSTVSFAREVVDQLVGSDCVLPGAHRLARARSAIARVCKAYMCRSPKAVPLKKKQRERQRV